MVHGQQHNGVRHPYVARCGQFYTIPSSVQCLSLSLALALVCAMCWQDNKCFRAPMRFICLNMKVEIIRNLFR